MSAAASTSETIGESLAYFLGWVAASFFCCKQQEVGLIVDKEEGEIFNVLKEACPCDFKIRDEPKNTIILINVPLIKQYFTVNKDDKIELPSLSPEMTWVFIRGIFDCNGHITKITCDNQARECYITLLTKEWISQISSLCNIKHQVLSNGWIKFNSINAVDFLSKIYDTASPKLRRYYNTYLSYLEHNPSLVNSVLTCQYVLTDKRAIKPSKANASDEGYDINLIGIDKKISDNTIRFETGIKVKPSDGWHTELMPRSSLSNSGWMLSNSIGLIDASYRGTLKVCLTKVDPAAKEITFPFKAVQMVFRKNVHFICEEVEELDETARSSGGFGSTDLPKQ